MASKKTLTGKIRAGTRAHGINGEHGLKVYDQGAVSISVAINTVKGFSSLEDLVQKATEDRREAIHLKAIELFRPYVPKRTGQLADSAEYVPEAGAIFYDAYSPYGENFEYANVQYQNDWFTHKTPQSDHWDKVAWQNGAVRGALVRFTANQMKKKVRSLSK